VNVDLGRAREISRRLEGGPPPETTSRADENRFVAFQAARVGAARAPTTPVEPEGPPTGTIPWDRLLAWARRLTGAEAVFVIDEHGLVIAVHGEMRMEELERIGVRLLAALDQARRIEVDQPSIPSVNVPFGDRWLSGLSAAGAGGSHAILGVLGPIVSSSEIRSALAGALNARLLAATS